MSANTKDSFLTTEEKYLMINMVSILIVMVMTIFLILSIKITIMIR